MNDASTPVVDTLFYDDACEYCRSRAQRLRERQRGGLALRALSSLGDGENTPGRLLMKRSLHLKTAGDDWLTGLDAALRAWSHTRYGYWLKPLGWPLLRVPARVIYDQLELRRYQGLYGCPGCDD